MNDSINIKIGAEDTGFESALKTVQAELSRLEGKVQAGDLSFKELNKTMKEIGQVRALEERLRALGDESDGATTKIKDFEDQMRRAEAITKANRSALEIYSETVDELQKHLDAGLISQKTYAAAIEKAEAALKAATPQTEEARQANEELQASLKKAEAETRALAEEQKKAEAITKATRTATEIYNQEIEALQNHLSAGRISMETFERAVAKADAQLAATNPQVKDLGTQVGNTGDKTKTLGGIFDAEFQKIAGAFTVGNLAAQGFQKVIDLAFDAARAVVQGFSDALDLGGRLNELSSRTGETAGKLLVLETAFKNSGLEAAQVGTAINKLQNFMQDAANGGEKQRAAMQNLGISMADLAGKTPTEQMQIFADKIAGIEDPTERAATASEVFGDKLGGKLLPLFSDFSGNLDDARDKVGSLEEVMDENAATFDAAAETIEAVKGKMAAFAAGVLSETIPAVQQLGSEMEQVDAAGLGETVGKILSPALRDFTRDIQVLLTIFGELKNQFTDLGSALVGGADNFRKISEEANKYLQVLAALLPGGLNPANLAIKGLASTTEDLSAKTDNASESIKGTGAAAQEATGKIEDLGTKAQTAAQNIDGVFSLGSDFAPKIDEINGSWGGLNEQILGSKVSLGENLSLADSMTGSIEEQVQALGGMKESVDSIVASEKQSEESKKLSSDLAKLIDETYGSHAEKLAEIQAKQDAIAAKEAEKNALQQESLNMELAIAEAKAAGDEELVKTLENQKLFNAELKKATDAGMGEPQARAFAEQMVNAKNAAASVNVNTTTVADAKKEAEKAASAAQSFASWLDYIKGVDPSKGVKSTREQAAEARKEIEAFGEYVGMNLSRMSYPDIAKKLGIDTMGMTGKEQMNAILEHIASKRGELTGIQPIDEKGGQASLENLTAKIANLGKTPQTITLDASKSIETIKGEFKKNMDLAISTGEGSKILGEIRGFVETIKGLVEKIEPKLPTHALA